MYSGHLGPVQVMVVSSEYGPGWDLSYYWSTGPIMCDFMDVRRWNSAEEAVQAAEDHVKQALRDSISIANQALEDIPEKDPLGPKTALERLLQEDF